MSGQDSSPPRRPPLTLKQILAWADAHRKRTGDWPNSRSGPVHGAGGVTWCNIDVALREGWRGLPGGDTLPRLLARCRSRLNRRDQPPLSEAQILAWADAHYRRTGRWPSATAEPIPEAPGLTWRAVNLDLYMGYRGLAGGCTLAKLLAQQRGKVSHTSKPPLTVERILVWAKAHRARTGRWPTAASGPIPEAPGDTWAAVNGALAHGGRGLPGDSSLSRLLRKRLGVRTRRGRRRRGE